MSHACHPHGHHGGRLDHGDFLASDMPEHWEAWAHLFEPATAALTEALLDAARVTAGTRVLDAACGIGPTTAAAHQRGAKVLGIDLHPDMVARARRRHPEVPFEVRDMTDIPDAPDGDGGWDAVVCRFGAHHVDSDAWFRHVRDRLRPGGRLAIAEWGIGDEVVLDGPRMAVERSPQQWADAVRAAGFGDITVRRVGVPVPFGDEATWRRFLVEVRHAEPGEAARADAALQDGVQHNAAYVVAGTA